MKKTFLTMGILAAGITGVLIACTSGAAKEDTTQKVPTQAERVKRGEYLVGTIGCDDCHSPKRMGPNGPEIIPELRLSGYPASRPILPVEKNAVKNGWILLGPDLTSALGPWGMSFAANLTSDETGTGNWTEAQFIKALREGKLKGLDNSRPLLPPMPWFVYKNMTDEDLKSIYAYLQSTKPVSNVVPAPKSFDDLK